MFSGSHIASALAMTGQERADSPVVIAVGTVTRTSSVCVEPRVVEGAVEGLRNGVQAEGDDHAGTA